MLQLTWLLGRESRSPTRAAKDPLLSTEQSLQPILALYFQFHVYLKVTKPGGLENAFTRGSSLLSVAVITQSHKNSLGEEGLSSAHSSRLQFVIQEKPQPQESDTASHTVSTVKGREKQEHTASLAGLGFLSVQDPVPGEWHLPRWDGFSPYT